MMRQFPPVVDVSPSRVATFQNCSSETILPLLTDLQIVTMGGGSLRIAPEDYVEFNPDGTCILKLVDAHDNDSSPMRIRFNPLAIPNINIRRTRNSIEFCDSIL